MKKPEILAPVGSQDALIAAVRSGADAVYFGTGECNARRNAGRFEGAALDEAVRYCHARNVAVYLTVNTLLRDEELSATAKTLEHIARSGADGIILQDFAVARLAGEICPSLALHASTQMAVHNAAGVLALEELGFSRIVLARELTGREIRRIREQTQAELEVFVHGALCMSTSGMCYLSATFGERSGNRGTCAQPCRLPFSCGQNGYCLSLKDMSHLPYLKELAEIGVSSFKIEGRMKRPEYVAAAVDAAAHARDGIPYETDALQSVFSRSGFTDGYFTGKRNRTMFGIRTQEDAERSKSALASFRELYRKERASVPVDAHLSVRANASVCLTVTDGTHVITETGPVPEPARKVSCTEESLHKSIAKTGGTCFRLEHFSAEIDDGLALSGATANELRRTALDHLLAVREQPQPHEIRPLLLPESKGGRCVSEPKWFLRFAAAEQFFPDDRYMACSLPAEELIRYPERIAPNVFCELPELCYPADESRLSEMLSALRERGITDAVAGNIGTIRLAQQAGLRVHAGYGCNITNHLAVKAIAQIGCVDATVSFELPFAGMQHLESSIPLGCIVAGHLPLMQLRACPARGKDGCGTCDGARMVTDRMGRLFPLICHEKKYSTLLNGVLYDTADKRLPQLDFYTVYLTTESKEDAKMLFEQVISGRKPEGERTTGMSFRTLL